MAFAIMQKDGFHTDVLLSDINVDDKQLRTIDKAS